MAGWRSLTLCLLLFGFYVDLTNELMLERLPRHIPKSRIAQEDDEALVPESLDTSVEKKRIFHDKSQISPLIMKPTWGTIYPFTQKRVHRKRSASEVQDNSETSERVKHELANILRDDEEEKQPITKLSKKDVHAKTKRQSSVEPPAEDKEASEAEDKEVLEPKDQKFQEWLRREYYRNIAKSFASMRRKRDESGIGRPRRRSKKSVSLRTTASLSEITDNLRTMEDQLFADALQVLRGEDEEEIDEARRQNRVSNDLNLAYDLERMRSAFFGLQETLQHMEDEEQEDYHISRKRNLGRDCPSLEQLTSDCSALSDIIPDGSLKRLLLRACNWHEVCYTCGKAYGLTSENCDGSFIEQTQTICRDDAPCESTASLLMVPLRQRRVFYKRNNPDICVDDPCVEEYLREGIAAMEEGRSLRNP